MTIEDCIAIYESIRGKNDLKQTTFYEGSQDEQSIFVPGWSFMTEEEKDGLYRASAVNEQGRTVLVQDDKQESLPVKLEQAAIAESLKDEEIRGSFIFCLLAGRLILLEDPFNCTVQKNGWKFERDNINVSWDQKTELLTVLQDDKTYYKASFASVEEDDYVDFDECVIKLQTITDVVSTSIMQDELLFRLAERYPDFVENIERHIDLFDENAGVYQLKQPSPSDQTKLLWVYFDRETAGVGIFPSMMGDDIGLHIDSVSSYIERIVNEEVILFHTYKNEEQFDAGNYIDESWKGAPSEKTREAFENMLADKAKGMGKLFNKNKVFDAFSWNGTYTMTVKI